MLIIDLLLANPAVTNRLETGLFRPTLRPEDRVVIQFSSLELLEGEFAVADHDQVDLVKVVQASGTACLVPPPVLLAVQLDGDLLLDAIFAQFIRSRSGDHLPVELIEIDISRNADLLRRVDHQTSRKVEEQSPVQLLGLDRDGSFVVDYRHFIHVIVELGHRRILDVRINHVLERGEHIVGGNTGSIAKFGALIDAIPEDLVIFLLLDDPVRGDSRDPFEGFRMDAEQALMGQSVNVGDGGQVRIGAIIAQRRQEIGNTGTQFPARHGIGASQWNELGVGGPGLATDLDLIVIRQSRGAAHQRHPGNGENSDQPGTRAILRQMKMRCGRWTMNHDTSVISNHYDSGPDAGRPGRN